MEQQDLDVKKRILLAAKQLFAQQGLEGTSVREICDLAGVNVSALSYYFGGKEKMFLALFEEFFPDVEKGVAEYGSLLDDPVSGLRVIIREVIQFRMQDPELSRILQREIIMKTKRTKEAQLHVFPVWAKARELLIAGREQGLFEFRSADQVLLQLVAVSIFPRSYPFLDPLLTENTPTQEEIIADTINFVLNGLCYKK